MKKNLFARHIFRKIKGSLKRFFSLVCMSFLGVGFFSGIQSTGPDLLKTLDVFCDEQEFYDIEIVSTMGLTNDDVEALQKIENVERAVGTYRKDVYLNFEGNAFIVRLMDINDEINRLILEDGHSPKNENEILVSSKLLDENELEIGDAIVLDDKEYKIVGTALSPLYFYSEMPSTNLGNGKIDYYAYSDMPVEDAFTNVYIKVSGAEQYLTNSKEYLGKIESLMSDIEQIKKAREDARFESVYGEYLKSASSMGMSVDISNLEKPHWYVWDRKENDSYDGLLSASNNLDKIGDVFPIIFFAIAILVSLISMMRMVEEDRTENGTLKSLGFNNFDITGKYIVYSLIATVAGGILGMISGPILLPNLIWNIYKELFHIPKFSYEVNNVSGAIGLLICISCICGTAIFVSSRNLRNVPATLMRPKPPKNGKKIILEKIRWLWKRLKFSNKITVRNIFRYKSRVITTIMGIAGCTALILAGFGLKDSLKDVVDYQFNSILKYDKIFVLRDGADKESVMNELRKNNFIKNIVEVNMETVTVKGEKSKQEVTLIVANNDEDLKKAIILNDVHSEKTNLIPSDGKAIISEKTSRLLNLNEGDEIILIDEKNNEHNLQVEYVIENYINQYVFITRKTYEEKIADYKTNSLLLDFNDISEDESKRFNEDYIKKTEIISIVDNADVKENIKKILGSINSIVVILIVAAALLAFVVLYNLSNINISERRREIATLKVLGFYHSEVDNYITRENVILTVIGIAIGLFGGSHLSHFIISTCEPDYIMFVRHVDKLSYVAAALITIAFTFIVNLMTHFNLKKIDMIDSLKNVE